MRSGCRDSIPLEVATSPALPVAGNITDFGTNQQFVQHVLSMDTTFKDPDRRDAHDRARAASTVGLVMTLLLLGMGFLAVRHEVPDIGAAWRPASRTGDRHPAAPRPGGGSRVPLGSWP
ncbi:DUF2165 family protein [Streptomyces tanashiensis]|uniref:DUF2165 family protein n=1 Tax=Streptomyces tanashiensis TaxID=67367 RepID=UPI0034004E18